MPVIQVSALPQKAGFDVRLTLGRLCKDVAAAAGLPDGKVWATWQTIEPGHYVAGGVDASHQKPETHPPVAHIVAFEGRSPETIEAMVLAAAKALTETLELAPGNAFVTYDEAKSGRLFVGGMRHAPKESGK